MIRQIGLWNHLKNLSSFIALNLYKYSLMQCFMLSFLHQFFLSKFNLINFRAVVLNLFMLATHFGTFSKFVACLGQRADLDFRL